MNYQEVLQVIESDPEYIRLNSGCVDVLFPGEFVSKTVLKADLAPGKCVITPTHFGSPVWHKISVQRMELREKIKVMYGYGNIGMPTKE